MCEEAENGSLRDFLFNETQVGRSPPIWRALRDAALGLRFMHQRGIIHGDLKCNNILVSKAGVAMLTDFGLSSAPAHEESCSNPHEASELFSGRHRNCLNQSAVPQRSSRTSMLSACVLWRLYVVVLPGDLYLMLRSDTPSLNSSER